MPGCLDTTSLNFNSFPFAATLFTGQLAIVPHAGIMPKITIVLVGLFGADKYAVSRALCFLGPEPVQ
jgi:hypothetical protein